MTQDIAWYVSLVLIGLLAVVFLVFINSSASNATYEEVAKRDYAHRGKLFWIILAVGVVITATTLLPWPHSARAANKTARVVQVMAFQWRWELSEQEFRSGEPIEFRVQSKDVNHGFGIYDPDMKMLAQVQVMPGYTNKLHYTFDKPGEYKILCMEFCGVAHHNMIATLNVLPADK
jgi:cytochrome c oxidase subunit 2